VKCESCKQNRESVKLREKLDSNLRSTQQRMCTPCARRDGWRDVTFLRGDLPYRRPYE
jgi:hypothetical protein